MRFPRLPWQRRRDELDGALDEEIRTHLAMAVRDRIARGEPGEDAVVAARREFGNVGHVKEVTREMWGGRWLEQLLQDLRYALRSLRRAPTFALVAILTIALGIGVNTAMFTIVDGVLLRPLPFADPSRLYVIAHAPVASPFFAWYTMADREYAQYRDATRAFESTAAYNLYESTLVGAGEPARIQAARVTPSFLSVLGVRPQAGRGFLPTDDRPGNDAVAMVSASLWRTRFGGDSSIIGRSVTVDGERHTIVGILPDGFDFPSGAQVYLPMYVVLDPHRMAMRPVIGRLAPGATPAQALGELQATMRQIEARTPDARNEHAVSAVAPLRDAIVGDTRTPLLLFSAAIGFVLLIACANVSNLMAMRAGSRDHEFGVRAALGAPRLRIVRQLLTESLVIAIIGGALGLVVASICLRVALSMAPPGLLPRVHEIHLDARVLTATVAACVVVGVAFGLLPALYTARHDIRSVVSASGRVTTRSRARDAMVLVETSLAVVLLVGAGLLIRSYRRLVTVDLGFKPDNIVTATLDLPDQRYRTADELHAFQRALSARIASIPGVTSSAVVNWLPMTSSLTLGDFELADGRALPNDYMVAKPCVSPGYFAMMRMPIRQGRGFTVRDDGHAPLVAVISRSVAIYFWPHGDAVGQRIAMADHPRATDWMTIVGVVDDVHQQGARSDATPAIYLPLAQTTMTAWLDHLSFGARVSSDGGRAARISAVASAMRAAVRATDADQPVETVETMNGIISSSVAEPRFQTAVLALFSGLALLLAAVGIYGVLAYSVGERMREFGVRVALGATGYTVTRMVLARTLALIVPGLVIGLAASLALTHTLASFLFEVAPTDPATLLAVSTLLAAVALVAAWAPARRAGRVDPIAALRTE